MLLVSRPLKLCILGFFWFLPRRTLLECDFFNAPPNATTQGQLDHGYKHFKAFLTRRGISCSQPPFTEKMVPLRKLISSVGDHGRFARF